MDINFLKNILDKLGLLRHPILIFGILGATLLIVFSPNMLQHSQSVGGFMIVSAITLIFATFGFYVYAYHKLPRSAQEIAFLASLKEQIKHDKNVRSGRRINGLKSKRNKR
jgi:hypothetical protein